MAIVPPVRIGSACKSALYGDGGNRTHAPFPPSELREVPANAALIPLRNRRGEVRAHAVVDLEDFERLNAHRWCISNGRWRHVGRKVNRKWIYLHREVLGLTLDDPRRVDHISRDALDNRKANLRIATTAENAQNQDSRGGSSRYRGVTWDKSRQKWMATAMLGGRRTTIGRFDSEEDANGAAIAWRAQHMPFSSEAA